MTKKDILMPKLGESVTEGTISKWLVSPGDRVNKYDPLAEVMTDKVNAEIPASYAGTVVQLIASEGETLGIDEVICTIETDETQGVPSEVPGDAQQETSAATAVPSGADDTGRFRYSPAVLKLSQQHRIDLSRVTGTGAGGRITRKDMLRAIEQQGAPQQDGANVQVAQEKASDKVTETAIQTEINAKKQVAIAVEMIVPGDVKIPLTPLRKKIAENMIRSTTEIPHAWTMIEADATNLVRYREHVKDTFKREEGFPVTYFAFFVKAVAEALKAFPEMNVMWAGDHIVQKKEINISIAVATEDAVFVPVIKNADDKSIKGIAREVVELAQKVRMKKLTADDIQGGTFTVNNTGSFGSIQSMGVINYPQAGILQVESIVKRPVIVDDMIAIRDMVNLCLSLDHRVIDGLIAGRFLQRVKENIEYISQEHTSLY